MGEQADPPECPGLTTEKIVYMPECFLCYTPPDDGPAVRLKPAQESYGCITLGCPEVQETYRRLFLAQGIQAQRLDLSGLQPQTGGHLSMYNYVDVALDTAPYAGTTTTCESLYMGVPVVTLRGRGIHAQNVGASLLNTVQLGDLVANTEQEYVQIASEL